MVSALAFALMLAGHPAGATAPVFRIGMDDAVQTAVAQSARLKAAERDRDAAAQRSGSQGGLLWPRLALDGNYRYVTEVPEIALFPGKPPLQFGDNANWTAGVGASWVAWDWGALILGWRSAHAALEAREASVALARRQARLEAVRAYLSVQMSLETVRLLADSLKLAQSQYRDIALRLKAGSASRLDSLQAHQDVLSRQKDFASARTALGGALQDLFALTRTGAWLDTAFPLDSATASAPPEDAAAATLVAATDPLEVSSTVLDAALSTARPDEAYPGVGFYARMADASRSAANGVLASNLPQLSLTARASRDYPNGPVLEQVNQRMLGAAVSFPLFEGGKRARDEWEQRERAKSFDEQAGQAAVELARDWNKARDALAGLKVQGGLDRQASAETRELAGLTYDAYKTGQARFTDVQAANLRSLHAVVAEARTKVETLMQLAAIKVLSRGE